MNLKNPFTTFPDLGLTDRQKLDLLLFELVEAKAEIRALTSLVLYMKDGNSNASPEKFGELIDKYQDEAIRQTFENAKGFQASPTKPKQN